MKIRAFLFAILAMSPAFSYGGDLVTLKAFQTQNQSSDALVLLEGEGAKFLTASFRGTTSIPGMLEITFPNDQNPLLIDLTEASFQGFALAGPATILFKRPSNVTRAFATFEVERSVPPTLNLPVASVVIPEDEEGQFQVLLESSTDATTWELAQPGNYGGGTAKRFFRTRIVRTN